MGDKSTTSVSSTQSGGLTSRQWQGVQLGLTGLSQYQSASLASSGAESARTNAAIARRRGEYDALALRKQQDAAQAATQATLAARGVDTSTGSGLDFVASQAAAAEFNEIIQRNMTADQVASFLAQAEDYETQARYSKQQAGLSTAISLAMLFA